MTSFYNNLHYELDADIYISAFEVTSLWRFTPVFLKLRQTGSVSRAKMSSFTCTFSHATNRWRREGDGENEKEPHKRMQQATVTRFPPQRRELASWLTEAKISVLNQRKNVVCWYLSAREAWNKVLLWTFQAFQSCICIGSANKIGYNAMLYERDAL